MSPELTKTFELMKLLKPNFVSISIGNVTASSSDVEVEIINEDPNSPEDDNSIIIESFGFDADVSVEDVGIGSYEFWGAKGVDSHMQNKIQSIEMTDTWPDELKWLEEIIKEKICDAIVEADIECSNDDYDPDPQDYDCYD